MQLSESVSEFKVPNDFQDNKAFYQYVFRLMTQRMRKGGARRFDCRFDVRNVGMTPN